MKLTTLCIIIQLIVIHIGFITIIIWQSYQNKRNKLQDKLNKSICRILRAMFPKQELADKGILRITHWEEGRSNVISEMPLLMLSNCKDKKVIKEFIYKEVEPFLKKLEARKNSRRKNEIQK